MPYFSEYEDLIMEINEDIQAGIITVNDRIKVVRKRKNKLNDYRPILDYYYVDSHPKVKYEEIRVGEVLEELVLRNMMR